MKTNYKILIILFLIFNVKTFYGQVETKIDEVSINEETTVTDCETIDLGNIPTNTLNFTYTLTKPTN